MLNPAFNQLTKNCFLDKVNFFLFQNSMLLKIIAALYGSEFINTKSSILSCIGSLDISVRWYRCFETKRFEAKSWSIFCEMEKSCGFTSSFLIFLQWLGYWKNLSFRFFGGTGLLPFAFSNLLSKFQIFLQEESNHRPNRPQRISSF